MLDFDRAIGKALEYASNDGETLIIVTADHETGGMAITGGDMKSGKVRAAYTSGDHTAVMVPVFAYGPGAENFTGIMENTDIPKKIMKLLGF
jgi:alkaline phosphatase